MAVNEHDETVDPADRRIAALYRQAAGEEAPAHLDARLMAAARHGLAPRAAAIHAPWWSAWRVPFAVAAVAVVSVSLVTLVFDEGGETLTQADHPSTAVPRSSSPPPAAQAPAPAPASGRAQDSERRADTQAPSRDTPQALEKAPAEATAAVEAAPAPAARAAAAPAPNPEAALRRQEIGAVASRARASPDVERLVAELEGRAPAAWIDRIAELRREGRTAEADGLLAEFTRRYPDEAVPPGLR